MWIEPNGVVKILRNIHLDMDFTNTIHFYGRQAQYNYFNSKVKYTYNKITYQRVRKNTMRVEINAENLYDCNYLMFQNTSFGDRWFYAFIRKVEYLSNMVSEIEYVIDPMQTWFWDCVIHQSFVEREHSVTDVFGANRVEENLEIGEYMIGTMEQSKDPNDNLNLEDCYVIIASTVTENFDTETISNAGIQVYNGMPSGLAYTGFTLTAAGMAYAEAFITSIIEADKESILDMFIVPKKFVNLIHTGGSVERGVVQGSYDVETFNYGVSMPQTIGSYTPRNKKVLQYPYQMLMVTDLRGNVSEYRYEDFDTPITNGCNFKYNLTISCDPSMQLIPKNYKTESLCYNEQMVYKGYPHVSWNTDVWKMYLAQNGGIIPTVLKETANAVMPMAGMLALAGLTGGASIPIIGAATTGEAVGGAVMAGATGIKVMSSMQQIRHHSAQPPSASGNFNSDVVFISGAHDFYFAQLHIRSEFAERIDKYFDMYGYATKTVKIPNIDSRPHWNYIKTIGANVYGNIPSDDLQNIKTILDNGITFWKNGDNIGDYSLDNRP